MSRIVMPPKLPRPKIAWPTIWVFLFVEVGMLASIGLALLFPQITKEPVSAIAVFLLSLICVVMSFTPSHEASHRNVLRSRFWNDWVGRLSIFWMHGSFQHFRDAHLAHHANANDPDNDPDFHASCKPGLKAFLWWAFSLFQYTWFLNRKKRFKILSSTSVTYILIFVIYIAAFYYGLLWPLLLAWTLPSLVGTAVIVYIFDRLPHIPHRETGKYQLARIVEVSKPMSFFMQGHNFHLIHHLWPSIPWYLYEAAYHEKKLELIEAGAFIDHKI